MPLSPTLQIGPAGWNRPDWSGIAFPSSTQRGFHPISVVARYTDSLEIDQTFAQPLKPEIAGLYLKKAAGNPRFQFTALLGRRFTYDRDLSPDQVAQWKSGYFPFLRARRLGALVMQFPWAFRFNAENREWLIQLRRAFHEFPLVAEFRHESWLRDEAVGTLIDYRVGLVSVDQPEYFRAMPPAAILTSGVAVVRMHGRQGPERFQSFDTPVAAKPYLYSLEELEEWLPRINRLASYATRAIVTMVNASRAHSLVNSLQLREMLGERPLLAPAELIRSFPAELAAFRANRPVQTALPHTGMRAVA